MIWDGRKEMKDWKCRLGSKVPPERVIILKRLLAS